MRPGHSGPGPARDMAGDRKTNIFRTFGCLAFSLSAFSAPLAAQTGDAVPLPAADPPSAASLCPAGDYPAFYPDPAVFERALSETAAIDPWPETVTGLTLPHHLVVPEMIAGGYRLASAQKPNRILLLMPDHFRALKAPFGTSARGYQTVLGRVPGDPAAKALLLPGLIEESCLFGTDHAIRSHLPFAARLLPDVPVLPIAVNLNSLAADWQLLVDRLSPLMTPDTLIVQSTDFSHYLPAWQARQRDQEVLNLLAAGDTEQMRNLRQPEHVDSVGANWLQVKLQQRHHHAAPIVLANRNQQDLSAAPLAETTSYMVILYSPKPTENPAAPFPGSDVHMIGGDFFLGRSWPKFLHDEVISARIETALLRATGGAKLILNLEGSLLPEPPANLPHLTLAAPSDLALGWAKRLNVVGFGLANNHVHDLGASGAAQTEIALRTANLAFARQGEALDLGPIRLVALSDFARKAPGQPQLTPALLDHLVHPDPAVPVIAFVHWGAEYQSEPSQREIDLALDMARRGVTAVIGAHPHVASEQPRALEGGAVLLVYSLGNFMFDQRAPPSSGALAELRSFAQGTIFVRQLPLPDAFNQALKRE